MARVNEEVASLLVPMVARPMLVPNVTVAEIVNWQAPEPRENDPAWMLGMLNWRGVDIPLVSLELMNDPQDHEAASGARIAVLNGVGKTKQDFYAVCVQGIPRLVRVYPLDVGAEEQDQAPAFDMAITVNGEKAVIPDLDYVEEQIEALL
ncbi:MAG: chemotaxis protein CheW [Gammaproteobacteria bacterium]|nr:MAG: chemotaxis protein CheW [Gammaproteobacteria bacterium]